MQAISKCYDDLCEFLEQDNKLNEFGFYGLSLGLLSYAVMRRRPLTRFKAARDIPDHFVRERVLLEGKVVKAAPSARGVVLSVEHKSPLNISFSRKTLPIVVGGVQTDANGFSWLQYVTDNRTIKFVPMSNEGDECIARVFILRENDVTKQVRTIDAAQYLVKMGFAKATAFPEPLTVKDKSLVSYQNKLKDSERIAKLMRKGQWHLLPENWLQRKLRRSFEDLQFLMKPQACKVPAIAR